MNLLAISEKRLSLEAGQAFWCSRRKYESKEGDLVFVYVKMKGIAQIFKVMDSTNNTIKSACGTRGMTTIWLMHEVTVDNPLSARQLKEHPRLSEMNAVSRNFQATTFILSDTDFRDIVDKLIELNPQQARQLRQVKPRKQVLRE